jgi:hypothetical protein
MCNTLNVTRGSDASFVFTWKDSEDAFINISGMTVVILDASTLIEDRLSGTVTNGTLGQATVVLEGTDPIDTGRYTFRVQLNSTTGQSLATPQLTLIVK